MHALLPQERAGRVAAAAAVEPVAERAVLREDADHGEADEEGVVDAHEDAHLAADIAGHVLHGRRVAVDDGPVHARAGHPVLLREPAFAFSSSDASAP